MHSADGDLKRPQDKRYYTLCKWKLLFAINLRLNSETVFLVKL